MNSQHEEYIRIFNLIDFEKIKDHPNILIAANFWDSNRYEAARKCYKFMRTIDDLIDNHKAAQRSIAPEERERFLSDVNRWLSMVMIPDDKNPEKQELLETIEKYAIPLWPLEAFANSMIYDIHNDGFPTIEAFLNYSQGASVAPASIFVHLSGLIRNNGNYLPPKFDVRKTATPCAIFSYLVHIIRDFQKDQLNNLNYFADDLIMRNGLTRKALYQIAQGGPVPQGFREIIRYYRDLADVYRIRTRETINWVKPLIEERYLLAMEIIYDLYMMVFERIDPDRGNFTTDELNPTPGETSKRVFETIMRFNG
jgi:phytoene synthase